MNFKTAAFILMALFVSLSSSARAAMLSFGTEADGSFSAILATGPCPGGVVPSGTPTVTVSGNQINVSSGGGVSSDFGVVFVCNPIISPGISLEASLGKLVDGTYTVSWTYGPTTSTAQFVVVNGALSSIYPTSVVGFWYDPNASGSGFNFEMGVFGLLVTYYGWDANGNRLWLTSDFGPASLIPNTPVTLNMSSTSGGTFANPQHDVVAWGTITLNFANCRAAQAALTG